MAGTKDLLEAYASLIAARPAYERAEGFYKGTIDEYHASPRIKRLLAKFGLTSLDSFNFAKIPVDAVANKLYLNALTAGDKDKAANDLIEDIWDQNELGLEAPILHRNVCTFGDAYVMVWPSTEEDTENVTGVDLINEDPLTVRVFYDQVNPRKKTFAIKAWEEGKGTDRQTFAYLYYADRVERYVHKGRVGKYTSVESSKWEPYSADGQDSKLKNPLGLVPFYHFRTDRPYGVPEHLAAYGPQLTINKLVTSHVGTIDYQSFPQRYSLAELGTSGPNYQQGEIDPFSPEDENSEPESMDTAGQLEADPGSVWALENVRAVGQFDAADADTFLKPFDRYIKALAQTTSTPFHAFDSTGVAVSAESKRETNEAFNSKVIARQMSLGFTYGQLFTDVLEYLGVFVERVDAVWQPLEASVASQTDIESLILKRDLGIPLEVLFVEAGYSAEDAKAWQAAVDNSSPKSSGASPVPDTTNE